MRHFFDHLLSVFPVKLATVLTFLSGLLVLSNILIFHFRHRQIHFFSTYFPFGLYHASHILALIFGFTLVYLSYNIYQRKIAAWWIVVSILVFIVLTHLFRYAPYLSMPPLITLLFLVFHRRYFIVRSDIHSIFNGLRLAVFSLLLAIAFGTAGFWFLDKNDFGVDFHLKEALTRTLREYVLIGNDDLVPKTVSADNFLDFINFLGITSFAFAAYSLFKPIYRIKILEQEKDLAEKILEVRGNSSLDFFKLWSDKNYFFDTDKKSFISFKVHKGIAMALGSPVAKTKVDSTLIDEFGVYCYQQGLLPAFYCISEQSLPFFEGKKFGTLKIGQEAIIDLETFVQSTSREKKFTEVKRKIETKKFTVTSHTPPHSKELMKEVRAVSDEWLRLPDRRERNFSVGYFDTDYIASSRLFVVNDPQGTIIAFVNQIRSYKEGEATHDLMRYRSNVPNGTMDYLFIELFQQLYKEGYATFDFGFSPIAHKEASNDIKEKALYEIYRKAKRFFSFEGLHHYKKKFHPKWENRYLVYPSGSVKLLKVAVSLSSITNL